MSSTRWAEVALKRNRSANDGGMEAPAKKKKVQSITVYRVIIIQRRPTNAELTGLILSEVFLL